MQQRILIAGGGFGGRYAALELDRRLGRGLVFDVTLVSRENYPLRKMLKRVDRFDGDVEAIDLAARRVTAAPSGLSWPAQGVL